MANIPYLTDTIFDHGAIAMTAKSLKSLGVARPLIVTDKGIVAAGLLQILLDALGTPPAAIFDETPGNPTEAATIAAADLYKSSGADSLIALGGGSSMDLAKGVGMLVSGDHQNPAFNRDPNYVWHWVGSFYRGGYRAGERHQGTIRLQASDPRSCDLRS
jgi:4-hydroxybutyrate dehydrogenase